MVFLLPRSHRMLGLQFPSSPQVLVEAKGMYPLLQVIVTTLPTARRTPRNPGAIVTWPFTTVVNVQHRTVKHKCIRFIPVLS